MSFEEQYSRIDSSIPSPFTFSSPNPDCQKKKNKNGSRTWQSAFQTENAQCALQGDQTNQKKLVYDGHKAFGAIPTSAEVHKVS